MLGYIYSRNQDEKVLKVGVRPYVHTPVLGSLDKGCVELS